MESGNWKTSEVLLFFAESMEGLPAATCEFVDTWMMVTLDLASEGVLGVLGGSGVVTGCVTGFVCISNSVMLLPLKVLLDVGELMGVSWWWASIIPAECDVCGL